MEVFILDNNNELGITQEYNKENRDKLWDSTKGKKDFREQIFEDNRTYVDPISGKTLHKSHNAAKNKYHMKNEAGEKVSSQWAGHAAEVDHINSLESIHEKVKLNPFLSDADFKEIANCKENYRVIPKSLNASKGEKSDWKLLWEGDIKDKKQFAQQKIKSDVTLTTKFTGRTIENVGKEFVSGAQNTMKQSIIPLISESVNQMIKVAQGEKELSDAAKDIGKTTVKITVAGGTNRLITDIVAAQMKQENKVILKKIANSDTMAQIITVAAIVQDSAVRYMNGEIDGKEFISEVGEKGTTMVAAMIGQQVGGELGIIIGGMIGTVVLPGAGSVVSAQLGKVIGEMLGALITSAACSAVISVINVSKHLDDYKLKERQIRRLEAEALNEMEQQRMRFLEIVQKEYDVWNNTIQDGIDQMLMYACAGGYSLQGVTDGINKVLSVFGKEVAFKNLDEYESQLDTPLRLSF